MKKLIFMMVFFISAQASFAGEYINLCPQKPYPVSNGFSQFVSNATGMNFLFTTVAESQMQKALKKDLHSKFDVEIKPYGAKNFLDGKFKSMTITSSQIKYGGLNMSDFKASTLCDYNQVVIKNKKDLYFPNNLVFNYSGVITSKDFSNTISSQEYTKILNKLNVTIANRVIFKVFDPVAKIANNRISMSFKVMTPFLFTSDISNVTVNAGLTVENEKIVFTDIDLGSENTRLNLSKMLPLINKLNPLSYEFGISNTANGVLKVKNVRIVNNNILVDGVFIIPKNYAMNK